MAGLQGGFPCAPGFGVPGLGCGAPFAHTAPQGGGAVGLGAGCGFTHGAGCGLPGDAGVGAARLPCSGGGVGPFAVANPAPVFSSGSTCSVEPAGLGFASTQKACGIPGGAGVFGLACGCPGGGGGGGLAGCGCPGAAGLDQAGGIGLGGCGCSFEHGCPGAGGFPVGLGCPGAGGFPVGLGCPGAGGFPVGLGCPGGGGCPVELGCPGAGGCPVGLGCAGGGVGLAGCSSQTQDGQTQCERVGLQWAPKSKAVGFISCGSVSTLDRFTEGHLNLVGHLSSSFASQDLQILVCSVCSFVHLFIFVGSCCLNNSAGYSRREGDTHEQEAQSSQHHLSVWLDGLHVGHLTLSIAGSDGFASYKCTGWEGYQCTWHCSNVISADAL